MHVTDMSVTLDRVTANNGRAQPVPSIDSDGIGELPRLVGMTGQLTACDLRTSREEPHLEDE